MARKNSVELEAVLRQAKDQSYFVDYDFSEISGIDRVVKTIIRKSGKIYGLVNNAATSMSGMLATANATQIEDMVRVNLLAPMLLTRAMIRPMMATGNGRIINIASINAFTGYSGLAAYAATKAGLIGFTKSLAREVGRAGITVNAVAPGFLETDMSVGMETVKRDKIQRRSPLKRFAHVDEVAAAVLFLLSEKSSGMTGTVMTVDTGNSA
jgi:3-oxoacyl-[acyl-carrier protein] reductase